MDVPFLYEFVILFLLSIVVTIVCNRLKLPATVGFLLTGVLCGPSLLGVVSNNEVIDQVAEIGGPYILRPDFDLIIFTTCGKCCQRC